jgi:hypothetical protein
MTTTEITEDLLKAVKDNIYVTWNEEDDSIKKMIAKNMVYLQSKVSTKLAFLPDSLEYGLLLERCRYDWNRALDEFEQNFASELLGFIQHYALQEYIAGDSNGE